MRSTVTFALLCWAVVAVSPAAAADIRKGDTITVGDQPIRKIVLTGSIQAGDADRLKVLIADGEPTIVSLSGDGGDYREALAIARILNDDLAMTIVEDGASCLSACAIAFLGGKADTDDSGDYAAARSIAPTARLALDAPGLDVSDTGLSSETVQVAFARMLEFISDFVAASDALYIKADAAAEMLKPRGGEMFVLNDAYRLSRLGVEIQHIAPPPALTLSMARNLCQLGWHATEEKPQARTDDAIAKSGWKPAEASFPAHSDYFGGGLPVRRTVIPFEFITDDPQDGYSFCLVDQTIWAGTLKVACRGFIWANDLSEGMERARNFDGGPDGGTPDGADIDCDIPSMMEPLTPDEVSAANRWGLVPGDTPLDKIAATLAHYVATEPPL